MADKTSLLKEIVGAVFTRAAAGYGGISYFPSFGRRLVELARVAPGASVLDAACGRGAVLFPAAVQVGPQGRVIGIDLSEGMVRETAAALRQRDLANAAVYRMDVEALDFPDRSFDSVLCGFGLSFFPNLARALSEFHRVLKPGGRLGVTTWGQDDPRWTWYDALRSSYGATMKLSTEPLDCPEDLYAALSRAGFTAVEVLTEESDWVCADPDEWWSAMWSISGRAGLEKLDPPALERFKAEALQQIRSRVWPDGIRCRLQAHVALASKA